MIQISALLSFHNWFGVLAVRTIIAPITHIFAARLFSSPYYAPLQSTGCNFFSLDSSVCCLLFGVCALCRQRHWPHTLQTTMLATIYYFNHKCAAHSCCCFFFSVFLQRVSLNGIIVGVPSAVKSIRTHDLNREKKNTHIINCNESRILNVAR